MSMHYGGEQGYGLFLNRDEADAFAHEYAAKEDGDMDIWDITIELGGSYLCDDEYDLRHVWHLDGKTHEEDDEDFIDGIFLYAKKQGCITIEKSDHAYKNLSEMADEFRTAYGKYFPDNFTMLDTCATSSEQISDKCGIPNAEKISSLQFS